MTGDALTRLREALEEHGSQVRGNSARCPAHDDGRASLSIHQGGKGAVLHCHAGCETDAVLEALGMSAADLFDEPPSANGSRPSVVATYTYTDEHGQPLHYTERRLPKNFIQGRFVNGEKVVGLGDVRRVLYRLPKVIAAVKDGKPVYVVEGEKDVHSIERAGGVATCNPMGALKWRPEYSDHLSGADVIIVADRDEPGRKHAADVAASLAGKAKSVTVVEAATGKDASDHLDAGQKLDGFRPADPAGQPLSRLDQLRAVVVDSAGLDSLPVAEPLIDGWLYSNTLAWLHGKPGHAKSFVALDWACCIAAGLPWHDRPVLERPALYVVAEGATGLRARVRAWEDHARLRTTVRFLPLAVQLLQGGEAEAMALLAADLGCGLVVIDTQSRVTVGAEENSAADMGRLVEAADKIREASRACVLFVHHEPRAGDTPRGHSTLDGAAFTRVRVVKDGRRVDLTNAKEKDSEDGEQVILWMTKRLQSVVLTSQPDTATRELLSDSEAKIIATLLESFESSGASASVLAKATGIPESSFYRCLSSLVKKGKIRNDGSPRRTCYVIAQATLGSVTPTTPTDSHSHYSNSHARIEEKGMGVTESLEQEDRSARAWPDDSIGAEANR